MKALRKVDKPLALYGYGKLGKLAQEVLTRVGIPVGCIIDRDVKDIPSGWKKKFLLAVCVTSEPYQSLFDSLKASGWRDIVSIYDIFEAYPECGITNGWVAGVLTKKDQDNIARVAGDLHDMMSGRHYLSFRIWHTERQELVSDAWPIIATDRWRISEVKSVLYGTELNLHTYHEIEGSCLPDIRIRKTIWESIYFNDYFGRDYAPSYLQIHAEGEELSAIKRNMAFFQNHRPIIAVTVYHTRDGLWEIEKTLIDELPRYRWYFRLHAYQGQNAIFYGVPEERYL